MGLSARRRPGPRRRLLLAGAALLAALALAEVALAVLFVEDGTFLGRPLPPFGAITHPGQREWLARNRRELAAGVRGHDRYDRELGWTYEPNSSRRPDDYRSNALAARGAREYPPRPPAGVTRILCFGDSFTYCEQVKDDETWPARIEARRGSVEAINFGVGAYGTDQALLRFRRVGRDLGADVIAIGVMLENIGRNVNRYRPLYYTRTRMLVAKPRFVLDGGELRPVPLPFATFGELLDAVEDGTVLERLAAHEYWRDRPAIPFGAGLCTVRLAAAYFAYRARQWRSLWTEPSGEPFRVTLAVLETFHREALAAGARAAPVLVFPAEKDLRLLLDGGARYWTTLTEALAGRGIPHLDLSVPLERHARRTGRFPYRGGHLDPGANDVVARALLAWLDAR